MKSKFVVYHSIVDSIECYTKLDQPKCNIAQAKLQKGLIPNYINLNNTSIMKTIITIILAQLINELQIAVEGAAQALRQ